MSFQTSYGQRLDTPGSPGKRITDGHADQIRPMKAGGGAQEVATVVVDTAANDTVYTFSSSGASISYTSDSSATKVEIAAGLAAAHNENVTAASKAYAVSDGVDTVTITAREPNVALSVSDSDSNLTSTTTTAASAGSAIPFGIGVVLTAFDEAGLPGAGTAQVYTLTPATPVLNAIYTITITGDFDQDGEPESYTAIYDSTDTLAATWSAGVTLAVNNVMPANSVLAADGTGTVTLTSENPGIAFEVGAGGDLASATVTVAETTANATGNRFAGVALKSQAIEGGSQAAEWPADMAVDVLIDGECWVELDSGISPAIDDPVYMRGVAGASEQLGAFRNAPDGDDSILLPNCYWTKGATTALDGSTNIAGLFVRL